MTKYYEENTQKFIDETFGNDVSFLYAMFEKHLKENVKILDIGFGSGRDSLYFQNRGYDVYSLDPVKAFCTHAKELGLKHIYHMSVQQMNFQNEFDGIWACASLLHIPSCELNNVFNKCHDALKDNGVMYCSFKYGEFEGERNGRFFMDLTEERLSEYITETKFKILEVVVTKDVRIDRNERWLNVVLKKYI